MKRKYAKIKVTAIVPAAGRGTRFNSKEKKPFAKLNKKPVLSYCLRTLQSSPWVNDIVLVIDRSLFEAARELIRRYRITKAKHIIGGGKTRAESVMKGMDWVDKDTSLVLVHDGVRPFVSKDVVAKTVIEALKFGASVSAVPVKATIKVARKGPFVEYTPNRKNLWEAQTPQVFRKRLLEYAYKNASCNKLFTSSERYNIRNRPFQYLTKFTDDATFVENIGIRVKVVKGDYNNIKITTTEDIKIAEALLKEKKRRYF
jgi:2-C-methyl-D-erythritol 4-phosphate cytidylyltransferase